MVNGKQVIAKGHKVQRKYRLHVTTDVAEDENFPFKPNERRLGEKGRSSQLPTGGVNERCGQRNAPAAQGD
jgi:hypothetical protein